MAAQTQFVPNQQVLDSFIRWIQQPEFDKQHAKDWARLYLANPEAAMCEASFWAVLHDCDVAVQPNRDLTGKTKTPDFRCSKGDSQFFVEVTCIGEQTATDKTGIESIPPDHGASHYTHLNKAIVRECINKTPQCANLDAPCLLAIGTFHYQASILAVKDTFMEWLLTGEPSIAWKFDPDAGRAIGEPFQKTEFDWSAFTKRSPIIGVEPIRLPLSALLIGGFGCEPPRLFGLLNPGPLREFDPLLLEKIPFGRQLLDSQRGTVSVEWNQPCTR